MSEIKGQLFGIILVIAIFAAVATLLTLAFTDAADSVASQIKSSVSI